MEQDTAMAELMTKMAAAVGTAKDQSEQIKVANVEDLDNPSDLLTREIENINDQLRADIFPEESAEIAT